MKITKHHLRSLIFLFILLSQSLNLASSTAESRLNATTVVFLQGTSRSGKSSICSEMEQYHDWGVVGSVYFSYCLQVFDELFPEIFACIKEGIEPENIRHAITKDIFIFKEGVQGDSKEEIILAAQKIRRHFEDSDFYARHMEEFSAFSLNEIHQRLNNSLHVLADVSWYVTQESIQKIDPPPSIFSVLVYCPFNIVLDRLMQRNRISLETANIMNYRFFIEPLRSFAFLYELSDEEKDSIDILEKTTFFACLDAIEPYLPIDAAPVVSGFMMQELTRKQLQEYREKFLKKFGDNEELYIIPKIKYDKLLRTDRLSSQECAEQIASFAPIP